jgi:hypothetical protein
VKADWSKTQFDSCEWWPFAGGAPDGTAADLQMTFVHKMTAVLLFHLLDTAPFCCPDGISHILRVHTSVAGMDPNSPSYGTSEVTINLAKAHAVAL